MDKLTLAEQVLQRMKEKRELQEKNRPHYEVLRLSAVFEGEINHHLKEEIKALEEQLRKQQNTLALIEEYTQELDATGKKDFPRIIIRPDFLASSKIDSKMKQFWLKSSNTFLRTDIIRNKNYEVSSKRQQAFLSSQSLLKQLEADLWSKRCRQRKIQNQKRVKVLKEDLRLRQLQNEIKMLRQCISKEREERIDLLQEYQLKKVNADSRKIKLAEIDLAIQSYQQKIQQTYNPITYREHLKKVFALQTKNQMLVRNIQQVQTRVKTLQSQTQKYQQSLEKRNLLSKIGKFHSPAVKKKRNNSVRTQSQGHSFRESKLKSFNHGHSVYLTVDSTRTLSKEIGKTTNQKDFNIFPACSPKYSVAKSTLRTSFPRYKSAFEERLKGL